MISRRDLLMVGGGLMVLHFAMPQGGDVPSMLDHILLGCDSRDRGIHFVEEHTGVRAAIGGIHPGRGTCNALLSLGERRYLEIIAPDPGQTKVPEFARPLLGLLQSLEEPRLVGWAAHPGNIEALGARLRELEIAFDGPRDGSRARPDGRLLKWKTINLGDDHHGVLPFFIEWDASSPHPSTDTPAGCSLERFVIADRSPQSLQNTCKQLGLRVQVEPGDRPELRAVISGPKGHFEITS